MPLSRYRFRWGLSGFFEFPTENARRILPRGLEPLELHHGSSVFSLTAFDFTDSEVGPYSEVVFGVIVPPLLGEEGRLAKSAFYPWQLATTTRVAREHAMDRWHLPHWPENVGIEFTRDARNLVVRVKAEGWPTAELTITEHSWQPASHLYQCFMQDDSGAYLTHITMEGEYSEHEEESGRMRLYDHPFNKDILLSEVYETPFREVWYRDGVQSFEPLVSRSAA